MNTATVFAQPTQMLDTLDLTPMHQVAPVPQQQIQPTQQPARQLTVVEYAMQNGATPAELKALLDLQVQADIHKREMRRLDDEREREQRLEARELAFRRDFAAFKGENVVVLLTRHVDRGRGGSFSQAEYHKVAGMLAPALSAYGFGFRHKQDFTTKRVMCEDGVERDIPWVYVTCFLEHRDGHTEQESANGPADEQSVNTLNQNNQSAASYWKRQTLLAVTGTATGGADGGEDDENDMRPRSAGREQQPADDLKGIEQAGEAAAVDGMVKLNAWWGALTAKQRNQLQGAYAGMRRVAKNADKGVTHG